MACCGGRGIPRTFLVEATLACRGSVASHGKNFSGLRLDDFDFRMPGADLFLEPLPGIIAAVTEQDGAWGNLSDEIQQVIPIGMRGEIEVLHIAMACHSSRARTEDKCLTGF